jgi:uncharacterized protein YbjT (DUF2867 family)
MRIFVAGASGVIGVRVVPLLVGAGHEVAGMTRSRLKLDHLRILGAEPVLCDVYDAEALGVVVGLLGSNRGIVALPLGRLNARSWTVAEW